MSKASDPAHPPFLFDFLQPLLSIQSWVREAFSVRNNAKGRDVTSFKQRHMFLQECTRYKTSSRISAATKIEFDSKFLTTLLNAPAQNKVSIVSETGMAVVQDVALNHGPISVQNQLAASNLKT